MVTFSTPGDLKTIFFPAANETPAMLMGFLYLSCWNLAALRDDKDVNLAKVGTLIKKEAIRQINIRVSDPKTAYTTGTISAIGWLSAGVMVRGGYKISGEILANPLPVSRRDHGTRRNSRA